jgi:hypothetical protein
MTRHNQARDTLMKTMLIGGPGHLLEVDAEPGTQHYDWAAANERHRYSRRYCLLDDGQTQRAFLVHVDLSPGEADALMLMQARPG